MQWISNILKNTTFKILLGFILIAAGSALYVSVYHENLFSYVICKTVLPVQNFFSEIYRSANDIVPQIKTSQEMEKEISDLKSEVRSLREITADYYELKRKNIQYEKYLEFKKKRPEVSFIEASVIGRDPSELFYEFTINKGKESGICEGSSVITENGFVGCVYKVETGVAKVRTILSPDIKLSASDISSGDTGIISGNIKLCDEGLTGLTMIPIQNSIKEGDMVTTTGLSGMYPKNLLVGRIKSVGYDDDNSSSCAVVEPYENIRKVRDVLVVVGFEGKGEIAKSVIEKKTEDGIKS